MKLNKLLIIALILFALICLPISFASESDVDLMGDAGLESESISQTNTGLSLEENVNQDNGLNDDLNQNFDCDDSNAGSFSDDLISDESDLDDSNLNDLSSDDSSLNDLDSDDIGLDDSNQNAANNVDRDYLQSDDYNKVEHIGDGNAIDYNSPNLSTNFTNLNVTFTDSNTIFVNASYTGNVESGTMENPYKTLNAAYTLFSTSSNTKTNIFLADGLYTITNVLNITKNLNLVGESTLNTIISGANSRQIFKISPPSTYGAVSPLVNFFNLTIRNGASYYGGAIYMNESGANFVNVNFINNTARNSTASYYSLTVYPGSGGAIYIDKSFVKFYNVSFIDNKALGDSDSYAGALFNDMGEVTVINSRFINNTVFGSYGAGGAIYDYSGILVLFNSTVSNNTINSSYAMGGGISTWASHNVYILNSTIDNNRIYGHYTFGSAMINKANNLIIANTTISNNLANGTSDSNGTFFNLNGIVNSSNLQFENNIAKDPQNDLFLCLEDQLILERPFDDELLVDLPSHYDLRDYGWVTSVKDQGGSGSCWAFSTLAALESYLLKFENTSYDFSENNMKNLMGYYGLNGTDWSDGGNHYMSLAYLLRWSGPVNETQDPFDDTSHSSKSNFNLTKHVQDVLYIPLRLNYLDINQIKAAIMTYGALYTTIHADSSFQFNPDYYMDVIAVSNHAITLIGWDDDYSADNFAVKPPGDGAFIIKNSWGTDYGYEGYWYISYYDKTFAGYGLDSLSAMAITNVENASNYKTNYQYDILGNTFESIGFECSTAWFANQFIAKNNNPLSAFGLYTYGDSDYLVNITVNGVVKYVQEGIIKGAGFHTIKLDEFVDLTKDDIFRVAVKLTTPITLFPVAIESQRSGYSSGADADEDQSFVSPDGINWYDLAEYNQIVKFYQYAYYHTLQKANVCLKAYASGYADVFLNAKSNTSIYYSGDIAEITLTITNEGDPINDIDVRVSLDSNTTIKSIIYYKGSFNHGTKVWHLDSLSEGESVVLKLKIAINSVKDVVTTRFDFNYSGYVPSDFNSSVSLDIYYAAKTTIVQLENITTIAGSNDEVLIRLLDMDSTPLSDKTIVVSLLESDIADGFDGFSFAPVSLITDDDGYARFILDLVPGTYKFLASFNESGMHNPSNMTFNVTALRINTDVQMVGGLIDISTVALSNDEVLIRLLDMDSVPLSDKTIVVSLLESDIADGFDGFSFAPVSLITDDDGYARFILDLVPGTYKFLASFNESGLYNSSSMAFNVSVSRISTDVQMVGGLSNISTVVNSQDEVLIRLLDMNSVPLSDKTIVVSLLESEIDGVLDGFSFAPVSLITDDDGYARFILNLLAGDYMFLASFNESGLYNSSSMAFNVSVSRIATEIQLSGNFNLSNISTIVNSNDELKFYLLDEYSNIIKDKTIRLTNNQLNQAIDLTSDEEGFFTCNLNLTYGTYSFDLEFPQDEIYKNSSLGFIVNVFKKDSPIISIDRNLLNVHENLKISLKDIDGNSLAKKTLKILINNRENPAVLLTLTDDDGIVELSNFYIGFFNISIIFEDDEVYADSLLNCNVSVSKKDTQIDYSDMVTTAVDTATDGRAGKYFVVVLKDSNGKPLAGKHVQIGFNGKIYNRTTEANGSCELQINLPRADTYTFAICFLGDDYYNGAFAVAKITVNAQKGSLTVPNKSYSASAKTKSLTATFKSASGKVVKGKKVTFTVNGKTYSATTNDKGVATVNVSLNKKGTYSFTAKFAGDNTYSSISKTAKLTLK